MDLQRQKHKHILHLMLIHTHTDRLQEHFLPFFFFYYLILLAVPAWPTSPSTSDTFPPPSLPPSFPSSLTLPVPSSSPSCCAWLLLFDLCPRLQVGGAGVQSWPITIRASPSVTRPLWGWIMSRLPTADSPVSGNLSNMDRCELRTGGGRAGEGRSGVRRDTGVEEK